MSLAEPLSSPRPLSCAAWSFAAGVLSLLMVWLGAMALLPFSGDALAKTLSIDPARALVISRALGVLKMLVGIAMLRPWPRRVRSGAALMAAMFWWSTLVFLFLPAAWVQEEPYSGFPYIGAGQGVLKHAGLGAIGFGLWARWTSRADMLRVSLRLLWAGQLLVLVWIGAIKFTEYEALGVEGLMRSSPLFSWLYGVFEVRGASNLIGAIELLTAALIAAWPWRPRLAALGLWMAAITYLLTTTFLFTTPGWQPGYGAPFVGGTGQFLLKDLGLLAGALVLLANTTGRADALRPRRQPR